MSFEPHSVLGAPFAARAPLVEFSCAGASLVERADIACVLVNAAVDIRQITASLDSAAGIRLPTAAGAIIQDAARLALWLTPRSWLVQTTLEDEWPMITRINAAFPDKKVHATLFTDYLCWLELTGPRAMGALTAGSFVSLERGGLQVGHAKRTILAGVAVVLILVQPLTWLVGVERSRARYLTQWLCKENS